jgi:DNA-3-methyladenine glycosylase I
VTQFGKISDIWEKQMDEKSIIRCSWCGNDPLYVKYHDEEWGVPVRDDYKMFEFLILETFQAGLSWITILRKRENFRNTFEGFDFEKVAKFDESKVESLMQDAGIIRNQMKIRATISNAQEYMRIRQEFGSFCTYLWSFTEGKTVKNKWKSIEEIPTSTPLSDQISKDLKKRGFIFVGSTMVYSHLQATGIVNDHLIDCFRYQGC